MFSREERARGTVEEDAVRLEIETMAKDFLEGKWDGDRDTRPAVADEVWKSLTTDRNGCLNRSCPHFKNCAQMQARKRLKEADVIVRGARNEAREQPALKARAEVRGAAASLLSQLPKLIAPYADATLGECGP